MKLYTQDRSSVMTSVFNYRWFDKSFSLIFTRDGQAALNFEHAWGDGVAIMSYFNEVAKEVTEKPFIHPDSKPANIDASQFVRRLGKFIFCFIFSLRNVNCNRSYVCYSAVNPVSSKVNYFLSVSEDHTFKVTVYFQSSV